MYNFRNLISDGNKLAFGCSHTYGVGVDAEQTWSYHLGAMNFGVPGCSSDLIARIMPKLLEQYNPSVVFVLWPSWTRFEYENSGIYHQSLPTDRNRIQFMETATDEWLRENFNKQVDTVEKMCSDRQLFQLTFFNLAPPLMEYACTYPKAKDNFHYGEDFHRKVSEIFNDMLVNNIKHKLLYE
jgi:hypothetical protein